MSRGTCHRTSRRPRYAVEGRKEHLKSINMKSIRAYVSLDNAVIGSKEYPVRLEKHLVPEDVTLSLVSDGVTVTIEKKEERWVRMILHSRGPCAGGRS